MTVLRGFSIVYKVYIIYPIDGPIALHHVWTTYRAVQHQFFYYIFYQFLITLMVLIIVRYQQGDVFLCWTIFVFSMLYTVLSPLTYSAED